MIYHYPETNRGGLRDANEVQATKLECTGCHQVVDAEGYPMKTEAPRPLPEGKGKCTMWGLPVKA